jgi:hypothetical protein
MAFKIIFFNFLQDLFGAVLNVNPFDDIVVPRLPFNIKTALTAIYRLVARHLI